MWPPKDCPCTPDCIERTPTCHGSCKKYETWSAKRAEEKKAYTVYQERYKATHAQKKALWLSRRRDNSHAFKKFIG